MSWKGKDVRVILVGDAEEAYLELNSVLRAEIRCYMEQGYKVKVSYIEVIQAAPWRSDSSYHVQEIIPIDAKQNLCEKVRADGAIINSL